jgi:predicted enzyme related to lactoylglutathione lyase
VPEITHYRHGVPNWVDVSSPDPPVAAGFYRDLFGWEADDQGEEAGHYHLLRLRGQEVAGLSAVMGEGTSPSWSVYVAVDDVDAACERASAAGGTIVVVPMDVMDAGRMAFVVDPTGAALGLWQPGRTIGSRIVNEPGAPVWHELMTRDVAAAEAFYAAVLGWSFAPMDESGGYQLVLVQGRTTAGVMAMTGDSWGDMPSRWTVYLAAEDPDAVADRARQLGGSVVVEPFDTPVGRATVLADPTGPSFCVIALQQIDDPNAGWPE